MPKSKDPMRSKYVFLKTVLDPKDGLVPELTRRCVGWSLVWALHEHDVTPHYHAALRFASSESWSWLRDWYQGEPARDAHSYVAAGRGWQRCVRYLLHLDSPDKPVIPRRNLSYAGEITDDEVSMLLGRPRASLLADIRNAPHKDTFALVDWLVNEKGHTPGEVAQMLRCITAVNQFLGPLSLLNVPDAFPQALSQAASCVGPDVSPLGDAPDDDHEDGLPEDLGLLPDDLID